VQDVGLTGADDPTILEWAAAGGRILFTHDVSTMTRFAYERVAAGLAMPGVGVVDAAEDGVGDCRISEIIVPLSDSNLAGDGGERTRRGDRRSESYREGCDPLIVYERQRSPRLSRRNHGNIDLMGSPGTFGPKLRESCAV
jgi:hypothetical protein